MIGNELDQKIQKLADLLVDIAWDDNDIFDILSFPQKKSNVETVKSDPFRAGVKNYGSI